MADKPAKTKQLYVANIGINYPSTKDGRPRRAESGDLFDDMEAISVRHELEARNISEYNDNTEGGE